LPSGTSVADSRERVLDLIDKHDSPNAFVRASTLAWTQAQVQLRIWVSPPRKPTCFNDWRGTCCNADASLRPSSDAIRRGGGGPATLWSQGISGDLPIVLLRIDDVEDIAIARQLLQAHEYWRMKQLAVDLVILNERAASYVQDLQVALATLHRTSQTRGQIAADGARGSVFILRADLIPETTRAVLSSVARVVLVGQRGSLADQLDRPRKLAVADVRRVAHTESAVDDVATAPRQGNWNFQRARGICRERARVRHSPRTGAIDPGTMDQRHRQFSLRIPGRSRGEWLHLVAE